MENIELLVTMFKGHIEIINSPQYFLFRTDNPIIKYVCPINGGFEEYTANLGSEYQEIKNSFKDLDSDCEGFDEYIKEGVKFEILKRYSGDITKETHKIIEDNINNATIESIRFS